jgi:uncharacterized protein YqgV (UPF0045/DUF77 family)
MTYEWNNKAPTALMLGRYNPWHTGHQDLFEKLLQKYGQVCIMVRDTGNCNVVDVIQESLEKKYSGKYKVEIVPNITSVEGEDLDPKVIIKNIHHALVEKFAGRFKVQIAPNIVETRLDKGYSNGGYISGDMVYIPIQRNASRNYRKFFEEKDWQPISLDEIRQRPDLKLFGFIQNPDVRHTKGVAMWLMSTENDHYLHTDDEKLALTICSGVYDEHTYPISHLLGDLIDRVFWIPLDTDQSSNVLLNQYFKDNGSDLRIDLNARENVAISRLKQNYERINQLKEKYRDIIETGLYSLYKHDRKLYKKVCARKI